MSRPTANRSHDRRDGVARGLGGVLESQLFGVGVFDPLTLAVVVLVLGTTAATASYLPARRATRLKPEHVLRAD